MKQSIRKMAAIASLMVLSAPAILYPIHAQGADKMVEKYPKIQYGQLAGKSAADYQFGFSFGGIASYADPVEGMANMAAAELGIPKIMIQTPQNWVQNEQNQKLDGLIAAGAKGIFMMTSEPTAGNAQITKMVNAGIKVVTMGGPPELPSKSVLTLATEAPVAAYDGTIALIKAMGEKGNLVALIPMLNDTNTQKRLDGIKKAVGQYPKVTLLQVLADMENTENAMTSLGDLLAARGKEIDGIMAAGYTSAVTCATFMTKPQYAHIKSVGFDTDPKVMDAIKAGKMVGAMSQNPWGQAYISMYTLKMLTDGWTYKEGQPEVINSGSFLITKANIDSYEQMIKDETFKIMSTWTDRFNPPAKK
ncbi:MAG: sugar ABC transporter substrate-binding protein [Propionivibrio sp.]